MPYIGSQPTKVVSQQSSRVYRYTATAGQTVFSGADVDNQVLNVTPSDVEVHMNGLLLDATDYTVTSSSVTLVTAANAGDELTITGMVTFEVADTYDKTTADARYVNAAGDTMTGALGIGISPSRNLDVENTMRVTNPSGTAAAELDIGSGSTWRFRAQPTSGTNAYGLDIVKGSAGTDIKMSIDSAGRVTMPYQPAFCAYPSATATVSGTGTFDTVQANLVKFNVGAYYNTSTYSFTAPVVGYYAFFGIIRFNSHSGSYLRSAFAINGTVDYYYGSFITQDAGSYTTCSIASVIQLSANDTVSLIGRSQSDATVDISNSGTTFSGYLIG